MSRIQCPRMNADVVDRFELIEHQTKEKDFLDDDRIREVYYPEIVELMKKRYFAAISDMSMLRLMARA